MNRSTEKSQVTTKTGDAGKTSALSGDRYPKHHPVMECVGGLDELRAYLALARLLVIQHKPEDHETVAEFLLWLLHCSVLMGSACSDPLNKHPEYRKGEITSGHVQKLEAEQARLEGRVALPKAFIVSATNLLTAQVDIARTVARRVERDIVRLQEHFPDFRAAAILAFINRLSDYLFILARYLENGKYQSADYGILGPPQ